MALALLYAGVAAAALFALVAMIMSIILVAQPAPAPPSCPTATCAATDTELRSFLTHDAGAFVYWSNISLSATAWDHAEVPAPRHGGPLKAARAIAIVHVAMADAVARATGAFQPHFTSVPVPAVHAGAESAIIGAAHRALVDVYPLYTAFFDAERAAALARAHDSPTAKAAGLALGHACASAVLAARATDGYDVNAPEPAASLYESTTPGRWRRDPIAAHTFALGGAWANTVATWVLPNASLFRAPPPPTLMSAEYSMEYAEALALGGDGTTTATVRDAWRTFVGRFWAYDGTANICAPARLYFKIAHAVAVREQYSCVAYARLFGKLALSLVDAGAAAWDSKYHYRRERPVTAIRTSAPVDGNPHTQVAPTWKPLGAPATNSLDVDFTPPFPAYPSGHAVFGGALAEVLRIMTGARDDYTFDFVSDEFDGTARDSTGAIRPRVVRSFSSFAEIEEENGQSRMYLGIHWASDKTSGVTMGNEVARYVAARVY